MGGRGKSERSLREKRRQQRPVILVVVEGETERMYFEDVKRRLRARWLEVRKPHCNDPRGLVSAARRERAALAREGARVNAWVVFDAEDRESQEARKYREAIAEATSDKVMVANSSPCFEYWLLLHYSPGIMVDTPDEATRELSRDGRVAGYRKPNLPYDELWELFASGGATRAAESRRRDIEADGEDPRTGRPVTYVDQLMADIVRANKP